MCVSRMISFHDSRDVFFAGPLKLLILQCLVLGVHAIRAANCRSIGSNLISLISNQTINKHYCFRKLEFISSNVNDSLF